MQSDRHDDIYVDENNHISCNTEGRAIGLMSRVLANGPGDLGFNPKSSHTKD